MCVTDREPVTSYIFTKYDDIIVRFLIEGSEELSLQSSFCKSVVSIHWFILHVWPFGYSLLSIVSKILTGDELKNNMKFCWLNVYGSQGTGTHWFSLYPTDNKTVKKSSSDAQNVFLRLQNNKTQISKGQLQYPYFSLYYINDFHPE